MDKFYEKACMEARNAKNEIKITDVLPHYGPFNETNKIFIYCSGFEKTLCEELLCIFDKYSTKASLISPKEIICETPVKFKANDMVGIKLKYGSNEINTNINYKFLKLEDLSKPIK